ncbi:hypothetical protein Y032_0036g3274 [Ancylostoma ceylanicum]|uniref:Uncharacterized protein n=1 Tax=Ancylostoma ceylanicum TaxID=53326 RepID=A0A016ULE2_9BILA|nr:hypothetical protein Y032_0036g3274 [Ancylostoma ceylanicum]
MRNLKGCSCLSYSFILGSDVVALKFCIYSKSNIFAFECRIFRINWKFECFSIRDQYCVVRKVRKAVGLSHFRMSRLLPKLFIK